MLQVLPAVVVAAAVAAAVAVAGECPPEPCL